MYIEYFKQILFCYLVVIFKINVVAFIAKSCLYSLDMMSIEQIILSLFTALV